VIKFINKYIAKKIVTLTSHRLLELRVLAAVFMAIFSSNSLAFQCIGSFFFINLRIFLNTLRKDDSSTSYLRALVI
jgi:hypothetical protein